MDFALKKFYLLVNFDFNFHSIKKQKQIFTFKYVACKLWVMLPKLSPSHFKFVATLLLLLLPQSLLLLLLL